ncbi:hypothetical protein PanWU01x14_325010 [Parasponia andersonii]|uniref:Uncharacterized protein n=1 Tax=Parasponia andersonii TaxID=3476 RepID=A0A2P5AJY8_PARAD|nr:hypothetical protein PanWU01x14_325010 [Parasponia andersonii]
MQNSNLKVRLAPKLKQSEVRRDRAGVKTIVKARNTDFGRPKFVDHFLDQWPEMIVEVELMCQTPTTIFLVDQR